MVIIFLALLVLLLIEGLLRSIICSLRVDRGYS